MEPLIELYLEQTLQGHSTVLFSEEAQRPLEMSHLPLTTGQWSQLGCPRVIKVQISAFNGAEDERA